MNETEIKAYLKWLTEDPDLEPPAVALAIHFLLDTEYGTKPSHASTRTTVCSWLNKTTVTATRYLNQLINKNYVKLVRDARNYPTITIITGNRRKKQ